MRDLQHKIFGIGLSRTGTLSLAFALRYLGYKTAHFRYEGRLIGDDAIAQCDALTDTPVARRFRELDIAFPGAKFIYTIRDKESWLMSCQRTLKPVGNPPDRNDVLSNRRFVYGVEIFQAEAFSKAYSEHHDQVLTYFHGREKDLLILNVVAGEGWEKLCPFLGHVTPPIPFPKRNYRRRGR